MKKYILLFACVLSTSSHFAYAGTDTSGGGSIWEMKKQQALTKEDLTTLLGNDSKVVKKIIEGLAINVKPEEINNSSVKKIFLSMKRDAALLLDDIRYSNYSIEEAAFQRECGGQADLHACTQNNKVGVTIYFNVLGLEAAQTTLAELVGLLMHEYSRHFVGDADSKHKLAVYFEEAYIQNKHASPPSDEVDVDLKDKAYNGVSFLAVTYTERDDSDAEAQERRAQEICKFLGYSQARISTIDWRESGQSTLEVKNGKLVQTYQEGLRHPLNGRGYAIFSTLRCKK